MKVLTVSDRVDPILYDRFDPAYVEGVDLVIACGDLPPEYLTFLLARVKTPVFYVCGNHDLRFRDRPPEGCTNLHGRLLRFQKKQFLGLEGSRWYNGGPYQYTENQMKREIRRLRSKIWWRGGVDIVLTHAPPRHIHDEEDPCHMGFTAFRWFIERYAPRYWIHGHIHRHFSDPEERTSIVEKTTVLNTYGHVILDI